MKKLVTYMCLLLILSCYKKNVSEENMILHYDYYSYDTLKISNALRIEYMKADSSARIVKISSSIDSISIVFKEKIEMNGIYRSVDNSPYVLTHSFDSISQIESSLPKSVPYFLNKLSKTISVKNYKLDNLDSSRIHFFDEAIPWYSYTDSYYCAKTKLFLLFYNPRKDSYFKLSSIEGQDDKFGQLLKIENAIIKDTSFFARYYKSLIVLPSDLK